MSFIGTLDKITKAYYSNDDKSSLISELMNSNDFLAIINASSFDIIYQKGRIELLIKYTGMNVADVLIDNTRDEKSKEFVINYCIAMLFKYNKYESAMMMTFKYKYNIGHVFNYMQESNTDINILKAIFNKYEDELNTEHNRMWLMNKIGCYNNIELLNHVEEYYDIDDDDIFNILNGTINKRNHYCLNTIKYIFENYEFDYDVNFMFIFLKELCFLEHDEAIHYVMTQLVEKNGNGYVDVLLNHRNIDQFFRNHFIEYFITVYNKYLLPMTMKNIINKISSIKNKELLDAIINNIQYISDEDKIRLHNIRLGNLL